MCTMAEEIKELMVMGLTLEQAVALISAKYSNNGNGHRVSAPAQAVAEKVEHICKDGKVIMVTPNQKAHLERGSALTDEERAERENNGKKFIADMHEKKVAREERKARVGMSFGQWAKPRYEQMWAEWQKTPNRTSQMNKDANARIQAQLLAEYKAL